MKKGGEAVTQAIRDEIQHRNQDEYIHTTRTRCNGRCEDACVVIVYPAGNWYKNMTPEKGRELVKENMCHTTALRSYVSHTYNGRFMRENDAPMGVSKSNPR
jgi:(2Fe-2S) ferredoxin